MGGDFQESTRNGVLEIDFVGKKMGKTWTRKNKWRKREEMSK